MIEQNNTQLILTFPSKDSATTFAAFLQSLFQSSRSKDTLTSPEKYAPENPTQYQNPDSSVPASGPLPETPPDSPEPARSRHAVLTPERQEQLFNQRAQGMTSHQRLLKAQATLRDGVLPFSKPGQTPAPSGQPSPRMRAQQEGTFADGSPRAVAQRPVLLPTEPGPAAVLPEAGSRPKMRRVPSSPLLSRS